jgi:hypothetical protein
MIFCIGARIIGRLERRAAKTKKKKETLTFWEKWLFREARGIPHPPTVSDDEIFRIE